MSALDIIELVFIILWGAALLGPTFFSSDNATGAES